MKITPIILSGGSGTRLWPLSRSLNPKQFLDFFDSNSLFSKTISRVKDKELFEAPIIVCNEEHRFLVAEDLRKNNIIAQSIILEPVAKNTAPAISVAAFDVIKGQGNLMLVMPSDHIIDNEKQFIQYVIEAGKLAEVDYLVTFGVIPDYAETGYGYIEKDQLIQGFDNSFKVKSFVEKPNKEKSEEFIKRGNFLWNSGIFVFKATTYLNNLEKLQNNIFSNTKKAFEKAINKTDFIYLDKEYFGKCDEDSIDYTVMEKSDKVAVIPMNIKWKDIGSWDKIVQINQKDENENIIKGDVVVLDTKNCYINSHTGLVATIGIENVIIVNFKDVTLIANKNNVQDVKKMFNILKEMGRDECKNHAKVLRPWGSFETISVEDRFKVKRIIVNPKSSLSLQMHHQRSEHWVVVKGEAFITHGEKQFILKENQSTYISVGQKHRLENRNNEVLEIIEIQTGSYLSEDDIVRFEDNYGRSLEN